MTTRPPSPSAPSADTREPLSLALQRWADELSTHEPPAALRAAVNARLALAPMLHAVPAGAKPQGRFGAAPWAAAALCGVLLLLSTALLLRAPAGSADAEIGAMDSGFVPVAGAERWPTHPDNGPAAPAWLVQAELPRERLAEFGLPFDPSRAADPVKTELLLRASGEVLAVRVLAEPPRR